jgi:hypothetical protein
MMLSEVARIREQIAKEYQSAQLIFHGFTQKAKHELYTRKMENIALHFEELKKYLPVEEAMQILIEESNSHA